MLLLHQVLQCPQFPPLPSLRCPAEYDDGSNSIDPKDMEQLLRRLPSPMGLGPKATDSDVMRFVFG